MLGDLWEAWKKKWPPNRVAVALCALAAPVLTIAGGDVAAWSATHFPTLHLTGAGVTAAFLGGAAAVALPLTTAAYKWFGGWIQHENSTHELEKALVTAGNIPDKAHQLLVGEAPAPEVAP